MPELPALRRVGHKGADLIVPGNTPASFDAALAAGVDMIEFDVLPERRDAPDGRLVLAHDYDHVAGAPALEDGLAHLASSPFGAVELDVDLKLPGYEARVVDALREGIAGPLQHVQGDRLELVAHALAIWPEQGDGAGGPGQDPDDQQQQAHDVHAGTTLPGS
ncbi:MAG TPA: glycerophosphodiester phosphodiesterase, partial [Gaiellales bacterium]|nr:glycerophosphodiester phosphodiesterase [Gaiellales bacterium]